jgi:uncharacterized membrane protein
MYVQKLFMLNLVGGLFMFAQWLILSDSFALKDDALGIIDSLINCRQPW